MSAARYPASWSFVMSSYIMEETIHLPPAPDMFEWLCREGENLGAAARACENGWAGEEEGMGEKEESLSLYKGSRNCAPPHLPGKLAYSPSAAIDGAVGLPTPVLMRNP